MRISEQIWPRVVALVCSVDKNGKPNVMTASFLMPVSFNPKYIAVSIAPERHTFENLKEVKEMTVNICDASMREIAEFCGSCSGRNVDKFEEANLSKEVSEAVSPPCVKQAPVSFECKVEGMHRYGDHFIVVGRVVKEHVRRKEFKPLLHRSGSQYCAVEE